MGHRFEIMGLSGATMGIHFLIPDFVSSGKVGWLELPLNPKPVVLEARKSAKFSLRVQVPKLGTQGPFGLQGL